jgi:hypothetical protein
MVHCKSFIIFVALCVGLADVSSNESISERTFIMVKPDGLHRGLVHEIIKRFEQKGLKLIGMKLIKVGLVAHRNTNISVDIKKMRIRQD